MHIESTQNIHKYINKKNIHSIHSIYKHTNIRLFIHWIIWHPSNAESSSVCSQLKIIMFLSYLERGFPLSLSTSLMVRGRFLPARCFTTRSTAALVASDGHMAGVLGAAGAPGTVRWIWPDPSADSEGTLAASVDGVISRRSRLNSLWDSRSMARYVVRSLRRM